MRILQASLSVPANSSHASVLQNRDKIEALFSTAKLRSTHKMQLTAYSCHSLKSSTPGIEMVGSGPSPPPALLRAKQHEIRRAHTTNGLLIVLRVWICERLRVCTAVDTEAAGERQSETMCLRVPAWDPVTSR